MPQLPGIRIPNWIQITLKGTQEGTARVMSFSFRHSTNFPLTTAQATELGTAFIALTDANLRQYLNSNLNLDYVEVRDLSTALGVAVQVAFTQPHPGSAQGAALPANAALAVSWRTGFIGRSKRGRNFLFGLSEIFSQNSIVLSPLVVGITTWAAAMIAWPGSTNVLVALAVASKRLLSLQNVVSVILDNAIDSQRKRLIGRGR